MKWVIPKKVLALSTPWRLAVTRSNGCTQPRKQNFQRAWEENGLNLQFSAKLWGGKRAFSEMWGHRKFTFCKPTGKDIPALRNDSKQGRAVVARGREGRELWGKGLIHKGFLGVSSKCLRLVVPLSHLTDALKVTQVQTFELLKTWDSSTKKVQRQGREYHHIVASKVRING